MNEKRKRKNDEVNNTDIFTETEKHLPVMVWLTLLIIAGALAASVIQITDLQTFLEKIQPIATGFISINIGIFVAVKILMR